MKTLGEKTLERILAGLRRDVEILKRRPQVPPPAVREIKVFSDTRIIKTGDKKFQFEIPRDNDGWELTRVEMYVTTVSSSGKPTVQLARVAGGGGTVTDMLSTKVEIDANEYNSKDAAIQPVIGVPTVAWGDHIRIDVDVAGTGAQGLGMILTFEQPD